MAILRIRTWGDPILKKRAQEIDEITDEIRRLSEDMFETMRAGGAGLPGSRGRSRNPSG